MLTTANTSRTVLSVLEAPIGQAIIHFQDVWLMGRLLASEGEEADLVLVQVHLAADQPVGPHLPQRPGPTQQAHLALSVAAPQVDQAPAWPLLQVQLPLHREQT